VTWEQWYKPPSPTSTGRRVAVAVAVVVGIGLLAYGAAITLGLARLPFLQVSTSMTVTTLLEGRNLTINGTTTLPDGAEIECETWHDFDPGTYDAGGYTAVAAGAFTCAADLSGWPAGIVHSHVYFRPNDDGQPAEVIARYGQDGERLGGPNVFRDSDGWMTDLSSDFTLSGT
jgi:hypothetical protein